MNMNALTKDALLDENKKLKQYIDRLNKECLELQAALFEEANRMTQEANALQRKAERLAHEKTKENMVFKEEITHLKSILRAQQIENGNILVFKRSLSSNVPFYMNNNKNEIIPHPTQNNTQNKNFIKKFRNTIPSIKEDLNQQNRSINSKSRHSVSVMDLGTLELVSRKGLFEALTPNLDRLDNLNSIYFQEFKDWISNGCYLTLPSEDCYPYTNNVFDDCYLSLQDGSQDSDIDNSENEKVFTTHYKYKNRFNLNEPGNKFMLRLDREEISPCLDFADANIRRALRKALPLLTIEMEPLPSSSPDHESVCPLVPNQKCSFHLNIKLTNSNEASDCNGWSISSCARQRIAAVADLFQYLTLVHRGLTGTPASPKPKTLPDVIESENSVQSSVQKQQAIKIHQFKNVQQRRAAVALARLGFGLPLFD